MASGYCRECGAQVRTSSRFCPGCGVSSPTAADPLAALNLTPEAVGGHRQSRSPRSTKQRSSEGLLAGLFGCVFGLLGIFTFALLFVPLAALCSGIGLLLGTVGRSSSGFGVSLLGCFLTAIGVVVSPSLWVVLGGLLVAANSPSTPARNAPSTATGIAASEPSMAFDKAAREAQSAADECRAKKVSGELKSLEQVARCSGERIVQIYKNANYPRMDLISKLVAFRVSLAAMVDRHELTEAEANSRLQKVIAEQENAERLREAGK